MLEIFTPLYATYAQISPSNHEEIDNQITNAYDPSLPIEILFKQIDDDVTYAIHCQDSFTNIHTVNRAFTLVFEAWIFVDDCREWKRIPAVGKNDRHSRSTFHLPNKNCVSLRPRYPVNILLIMGRVEEDNNTLHIPKNYGFKEHIECIKCEKGSYF